MGDVEWEGGGMARKMPREQGILKSIPQLKAMLTKGPKVSGVFRCFCTDAKWHCSFSQHWLVFMHQMVWAGPKPINCCSAHRRPLMCRDPSWLTRSHSCGVFCLREEGSRDCRTGDILNLSRKRQRHQNFISSVLLGLRGEADLQTRCATWNRMIFFFP